MAGLGDVTLPVELKVKGFKAMAQTLKAQTLLLTAVSNGLLQTNERITAMTEALSSRLDRINEDYDTLIALQGEQSTTIANLQTANAALQTALDNAGVTQDAAVAAATADLNAAINAASEKAGQIDDRVANPSDTPAPPVDENPTPPVDENPPPVDETPAPPVDENPTTEVPAPPADNGEGTPVDPNAP